MIVLEPAVLDRFPDTKRARPAGLSRLLDRRLHLLSDEDRLLLEMVYELGLTRRQIGVALKVSPGNVSRRLRRLVRRMHDPLVASLCDPHCPLDEEHRRVGLAHSLHHRTIEQIAASSRLTRQRVGRMLEYIRGWHRGLSGPRA